MHDRRNLSLKLSLLVSPLFVISLSLLGINDLLLKPIEINWFTGKLSDFAGLAALFLFLAAFFPDRTRTIAWSLAAAWIFWKLPLSRAPLHAMNELLGLDYVRSEDLTDLVAIVALPTAYRYAMRYWPRSNAFTMQHGLAVLTSLILFTGTSKSYHYSSADYRIDYYYDMSVFKLRDEIRANVARFEANPSTPGKLELGIAEGGRDSVRQSAIDAHVTIGENSGRSRLRLSNIGSNIIDESGLLPYFESNFITGLPAYQARQERMWLSGAHGTPAGPIFMIILGLWPLMFAIRKRNRLIETWREQERDLDGEVFNALQFLLAFIMIGYAIYCFIDAIYVGGPYVN